MILINKKEAFKMSQVQQRVFDKLDAMGIRYKVLSHEAVYTIDEIDDLHIDNGGEVVKNLFLRDDKKKRYFLVVLQKDKKADLKELRIKLNSRPLSFASEENLHKYMGLNKGSVTPFGVLNDTSCIVEVVFDHDLLSFEHIGVHPNENTATIWIHLEDLENVIKDHGNKILHIEI
jgi:Ala-tRNA(Pro) deacylase